MKDRIITLRRIISFMLFMAFIAISLFNYYKKVSRINSINEELKQNNSINEAIKSEGNDLSVIDDEKLTENDRKIKEFFAEINENKNGDKFYSENYKYIYDILNKIKICGDSNVNYLNSFGLVNSTMVGIMKGKSPTEQLDLIDEFVDMDTNIYALWNGYNIKYYKDSAAFVESYDKLIEKIKSINENAKVYVCSLLPATDKKVKEDLESDFVHNLYKGPEYDLALQEHFGEYYIDTKKLMVDEFHIERDGVHFNPTFNKMLLTWIALYVNGRENLYESEAATANALNANKKNKTNNSDVFDIRQVEPSMEFEKYFGIENVNPVKKYKYDNLELLYQCEQFINNMTSDKIPKFYYDNYDYIVSLMDGVAILGDSNVGYIYTKHGLLPEENVYGIPGKSVSEQYSKVGKFDYKSLHTLIIWNGYVIKEFNDGNSYIEAYTKLVDKIKKENPDLDIYVCSLLPASEEKSNQDIKEGFPHNIYKWQEFDDLLKETFGDHYIDTKFLVEEGDHALDGFHLNSVFSMKLVNYVALYVNCKRKINDNAPSFKNDLIIKEPEKNKKLVYLTFDDGPGEYGDRLLDIFERYNIKVTFFLTGNGSRNRKYMNMYKKAGHTIAAHTYTHNFKLYQSEQTYFEDLYKIESLIRMTTGEFTNIVRFPGGSGNISSKSYSEGIMKKLIEDFDIMGYYYYDWNVSSGDGSTLTTQDKIMENALSGIMQKDPAIVLFHETHETTVNIIEPFVDWALQNGYEFRQLEADTMICHQSQAYVN